MTDRGKIIEIPVGTTLEAAEVEIIRATVLECGGNKTKAARILGISVKSIYNRLCAAEHSYVDYDTPQVYCARDDHRALVKIGWSRSPADRIRTITLSSGVDMRLLGTVTLSTAGRARKLEAHMHQQYAQFKQTNEWFDDVNEQVSSTFLRDYCSGAIA